MRARWVAVALCLVGLVACEGTDRQSAFPFRTPQALPSAGNSMIIVLIGTMTGPDKWRGTDAFEGADLGVHELNENLQPGRPQFELVTENDHGDASRATDLVRRFAALPRTVGVVYAGPPEGLPPAELALEEAHIPAILCYGDLYGAGLLRSHTFQVAPPFAWEAKSLADYLIRDRGYGRVGALVESSMTGTTALRSLKPALRADKGSAPVAVSYRVDPTTGAIAHQLRKLRGRRVQAIVVQASPIVFAKVIAKLRALGAGYRSTSVALRDPLAGRRAWHPQVVAFDSAITPTRLALPSGTIASDTYARGDYFLPLPSFKVYRAAFQGWWATQPLGWELRAYEAVQMIGWADLRTDVGKDIARELESLHGQRFGGLTIDLGARDHVAVDPSSVGLWTVATRRERAAAGYDGPASLPWLPLARSFANGRRTDVAAQDWAYLFSGRIRPHGPPPEFSRMRYAVTTPRSDPIH